MDRHLKGGTSTSHTQSKKAAANLNPISSNHGVHSEYDNFVGVAFHRIGVALFMVCNTMTEELPILPI